MGPDGWREVKIEKVVDKFAMGPFGSNIKSDNFVEYGVPVIRGGNLSVGKFNDKNFVYLTEEKADELKGSNAFADDIVFTHRGTLGQVGIIPQNKHKRYVISQSQMKITCNKELTDPQFIYYFFKSPIGQHKLLCNTSTTGVPAIARPLTSLKSITIDLPTFHEQKTIAATLSCLDDKIELNNRINKTLEEMALAIFKSWFVDFEPFQDGEFEDNELGRIPKGWRAGILEDVIELFDSKRIPLSSRKRETMQKIYPYYGATSLMDYVDDYIFDGIYVLLGEDGTVVDSQGYPILQYVWGKFWVNNHAHVLKGKSGFNEDSIYMLLKNTNIQGIVTGAVQLKINQANLKSVKVIIPADDDISKFNYLLEPLFAEKRRIFKENQTLTAIRDSLLPKLMSGEIRVPVEEVQ
ncbi:MAG: restriction endonuclease subunit S [Syntrophomonadaceae bacterium]|nr:restriction endonuclease subunit S [Syntrophomonadaceae bacterium]